MANDCARRFQETKAENSRFPVVALMAVLGAASSMTFAADAMSREAEFNIPPQSIESALHEFSKQANVQVMVRTDAVDGVRTGGVKGYLTAENALSELLKHTELTYEEIPGDTVTVKRLAEAARATGAEVGRKSDSKREPPGTRSTDDSGQRRNLEEIIVTAQKRGERLQDVPISMSVLGGVELDSAPIDGVSEALRRVPGVGINTTYQGGGTQIVMRGVTAGGPLFNGSSPVSYYLDSIPFGLVRQAINPDVNAYDLDRVEVLRGPQGTLYGANAQNGVVRVITRDADPSEFDFKARTSGALTEGGSESYRGDMAVNVPIFEGKVGARAVAGYQQVGGWIDRPNRVDFNDGELRNLRLKVNALPMEQLSIGLSGWFSRADYGGPSIGDDNGKHSALRDEPITTDLDAYSFKVGYKFSNAEINATTSYLDYLNDGLLDAHALQANLFTETKIKADVFAQEVLVSSVKTDVWRWSIGGMYRDAKDSQYQTNVLSTTGFASDQTYKSESYAVFGELTRRFREGVIELTGGLRYFEDRVRGIEDARITGAQPLGDYSDVKFDAVSPRVVLNWHPSSNSTLYASYAEGFRSGLPQSGSLISSAAQFPPLEPDTLRNYEIGAKGSYLEGRITMDAALYYIDWKDVQQSLTVPVPGTVNMTTALINGDSASGVGLDVGIGARVGRGIELGMNASWNDLKMDSDVFSFVTPTSKVLLFAAGDRLNYSPEITAAAYVDYGRSIGDKGYEGLFSVSANYTSEMDVRTIVGGVQRIADGDAILAARASFSLQSPDKWSAMLFVDNLTNEQGSPVRYPFVPAITDWNAQIRPRTVGLQLEYVF